MFLCVYVCLSDRVQRQEREVMLKLKQVVDKQRDELRAKVQENTTISKEVEAVRHKKNLLICSSRSLGDEVCLPSGKMGRFQMSWGINCRYSLLLSKGFSQASVSGHVCHMS